MAFPRDAEYKISFEAIDLISALLQDKEHRLCSKQYRLNDHRHRSRHEPAGLVSRLAESCSSDDKSRFIYPDDATDIKSHSFFDRVAWDRHHLTRPPFVPDVKSKEDTRYFDEEDPVSDVKVSTTIFASDAQAPVVSCDHTLGTKPFPESHVAHQVGCATANASFNGSDGSGPRKAKEDGKVRKRPRDKVLRDKGLSRQALEVRKKGVFIGYTYRRPRGLIRDSESRGSKHNAS